MNIALELATKLASAGLGTLGQTIFVGRIPASNTNDGLWSVTATGGAPEGGNVAKWRTRTQLQVMFHHSDAAELYDKDEAVKIALSELPYVDARFIDVTVGALQDQDLAESERRIGVWGVEVVTFNTPQGEEEES